MFETCYYSKWSTISPLTFQSLAVTLRTTSFQIQKNVRGAHSAFMCFVWISEQTASFALYNIKIGFYNQRRECLQRGTD
jgi:hypothetical protein